MIRMYEVMDSKSKRVYTLGELIDMYDEKHEDYDYVIKRLICPSCGLKVSEIEINDKDSTIKTKRDEHKVSCDFHGFKYSQSKIKRDIKNNIDLLSNFNPYDENTPNLPKKNIERILCCEDIDVFKVLYGKVRIKTAHSKDELRYINFSLKAPRGDIITISFQDDAIKSFEKGIKLFSENIGMVIDVKILGSITKFGDYNNIIIKNPNCFKYKIVENEIEEEITN